MDPSNIKIHTDDQEEITTKLVAADDPERPLNPADKDPYFPDIGMPTKVHPLNKSDRNGVMVEQPNIDDSQVRDAERKLWAARAIMRRRCFDPIYNMINVYNKLCQEVSFYDRWRAGLITPMTEAGHPRRYNQEVHMSLYDKMTNVLDKLIKYAYIPADKLPQGPQEQQPQLVITLHTEDDSFDIEERMRDDEFVISNVDSSA